MSSDKVPEEVGKVGEGGLEDVGEAGLDLLGRLVGSRRHRDWLAHNRLRLRRLHPQNSEPPNHHPGTCVCRSLKEK